MPWCDPTVNAGNAVLAWMKTQIQWKDMASKWWKMCVCLCVGSLHTKASWTFWLATKALNTGDVDQHVCMYVQNSKHIMQAVVLRVYLWTFGGMSPKLGLEIASLFHLASLKWDRIFIWPACCSKIIKRLPSAAWHCHVVSETVPFGHSTSSRATPAGLLTHRLTEQDSLG